MFEYLISCLERSKVVQVEKKAELPDKIRDAFKIPSDSEVNVQIFNEKWQALVDVDNLETLPDSCQLSVSVITTVKLAHQDSEM
jgi:hypothetical protein